LNVSHLHSTVTSSSTARHSQTLMATSALEGQSLSVLVHILGQSGINYVVFYCSSLASTLHIFLFTYPLPLIRSCCCKNCFINFAITFLVVKNNS